MDTIGLGPVLFLLIKDFKEAIMLNVYSHFNKFRITLLKVLTQGARQSEGNWLD